MMAPVMAELVTMATHGAPVVRLASVQPGEIIVTAIVFGAGVTLFSPLVRAWARRIEGKSAPAAPQPANVEDRLDRIERAVDAVALEVERISEGQRFVTKLLAEKASTQLPPGNG